MLTLPPAPAEQRPLAVQAWSEAVIMPTYLAAEPERLPMFLERRVYQGSSGAVYPLPCVDRVAAEPVFQAWEAIHLENRYVRVMILPQLGGRIHVGLDKTNGYDFVYRQNSIKPALVGLAGPWCSGGIEFNWPQHHRPATAMPVETFIERHDDGSVTCWCSDHDPMARMKGMHGVRLHPDSNSVEVVVRLHNRTAEPQTFLWWANLSVKVHERYQSFFPDEVRVVADHAKRAMSTFPHASGHYYGVDYAERGTEVGDDNVRGDDLTWWRNIPVPTSYMVLGTARDYFGGYDHAADAGVVHVADHHVAPGKKQWTWGNHAFGEAWNRHLTDGDGPYIELMAGVFTDNQPDFSWLQPGETRTFTQRWYPIRQIGAPHHATADGALHLSINGKQMRVGVAVSRAVAQAEVTLSAGSHIVRRWVRDLAPDSPLVEFVTLEVALTDEQLTLRVDVAGRTLIEWRPKSATCMMPAPQPATEPAAPSTLTSVDELYLTGVHLNQYRHATRSPIAYWTEALKRDPGESRCHTALGWWHLRRGEFSDAEGHLRAAIARLTMLNPNPANGEAHYALGLCLRHQGRDQEAYTAIAKSCWNEGWAAAGHQALGELDARRGDWANARTHLELTLRHDADRLAARNLLAIAYDRLGQQVHAERLDAETAALDPLDGWIRFRRGLPLTSDAQLRIDLAVDAERAGLFQEALALLADAETNAFGATPLVALHRAWLCHQLGQDAAQKEALAELRSAPPDWCFPARLEELVRLEWAVTADPDNGKIRLYLGNWCYDRRRYQDAINHWRVAVQREPSSAMAWRNLGLATFNVLGKPATARRCYEKALDADPGQARLLMERDQLWARTGRAPKRRLQELQRFPALVSQRDDLSMAHASLLCQVGRPADAINHLSCRQFQPWEGGEGQVLAVWRRAHLALAKSALAEGQAAVALRLGEAVLNPPQNLGEVWHLLQNLSDVWLLLGDARHALGREAEARSFWRRAGEFNGDFQEMRVRQCSELTLASARALQRLGRKAEARALLLSLASHARQLRKEPASIDYFATSLPTMLLFHDDLGARQRTTATLFAAQAAAGLNQRARAKELVTKVLAADPGNAHGLDLLAELTRK